MKTTKIIFTRLIGGCVLAFGLTSNIHGQDINLPPDPGTNGPGTNCVPCFLAALETNRLSVLPWLHDGYALPDGTPADFQTIMDQQAMAFSAGGSAMVSWQTSVRDDALTWAWAVGAPDTIPGADGTTAYLMERENGFPLYVGGCNVDAAETIATDKVWPGGSAGLSLNGTNRVISMWDEGMVRLTHSELTNRVTMLDGNASLNNHSTGVAGTLAAVGANNISSNGVNIGKAAKGMSFASLVQARDFNSDFGEMIGAVGTNNMRLSNHSYGHRAGWYQDINGLWYWLGNFEISTNQDPKFGNYTTNTTTLDQIIQNAPTYLGVWAAGNDQGETPPVQPTNHAEFSLTGSLIVTNALRPADGDAGGFDTMGDYACAKNVLSVGAVFPIYGGYTGTSSVVLAPFSSIGPTDDGRIKPDVVADGVAVITTASSGDLGYQAISGTSFSAPSVAGSVNLLFQYYKQLHPNAPDLLASTLKGLVIHTADEAGTNAGPDYRFGWGLMDTARAASLIGNNATNGLKNYVKEVLLLNGTKAEFPVVSAGTNALRITICWTDPAATGNSITNLDNSAIKLVNDLDLRVISPNGNTNFPWVLNPDLTNQTVASRSTAATTGDNIRDNVEQVYLANPTNGTYTVRVTHKGNLQSNATQWVSVLLSGITPQQPPSFKINQILQTATNSISLGWPAVVGQRYQVQYVDAVTATNWANIGAQVSARLTNVVVAVVYTNTVPQRFYRAVQVP